MVIGEKSQQIDKEPCPHEAYVLMRSYSQAGYLPYCILDSGHLTHISYIAGGFFTAETPGKPNTQCRLRIIDISFGKISLEIIINYFWGNWWYSDQMTVEFLLSARTPES